MPFPLLLCLPSKRTIQFTHPGQPTTSHLLPHLIGEELREEEVNLSLPSCLLLGLLSALGREAGPAHGGDVFNPGEV